LCQLSKSIYNEILFRIYSNTFQIFRLASLVRASPNSTRDNITQKTFLVFSSFDSYRYYIAL